MFAFIKTLFKDKVDKNSNEYKINLILEKVSNDYYIQNSSEKKDHNYYNYLHDNQDRILFKECEKLMKKLELTYYFEDDAMGAQFYIIYDKNKKKLFTSEATCFTSIYKNYSLYMKLLDYEKELNVK